MYHDLRIKNVKGVSKVKKGLYLGSKRFGARSPKFFIKKHKKTGRGAAGGRAAAGFFVFRAGPFFSGVCKHPRPTGIGGALHVVHECAGTIQSKSADLTSFSGK